jgi:hypothetical protein
MDYRLTLEIGNVELKILNLCKTAIQLRYSKDKFKREVDKLINGLCERIEYSYLKEKTRNSLRAYSERCYAKEWQIYTEMAAMYAVLLIGIERKERKAEAFKKEFDKTTSDRIRHSPGFLNIVNSKKNDSFYPHSLPLNVYHKTYMKRVEELTKELVDIEAKEDYKTNVSLRNIAEMTIRYEHQLDMIEEKRRSGKKLVYILAHANASERCQKYQVGGTKHSSGLYSLDGTSGTTEDGIKYVPLEFATNNPEDQYTTKAGITYQNGCLTGFNCRHKLGDYIPGVTPQPIDENVIEKRRELETKQRDYERQIRKYKKAAAVMKDTNPKQAKIFKDAAHTKFEKYKEFSLKNNIAFYTERTKLFEDDNQNELTKSEKSAILFMNNRDVRKWYVAEIAKISELDNPDLSLRERALIAFNRRNELRFEAREKMADFDTRSDLDEKHPQPNFDKFVEGKMAKMGLTREETYFYILDSAKRANANVNKELKI